MFTGIIQELGIVKSITPHAGGARLEIAASKVVNDTKVGDSIAVNGCCLTVVLLDKGWWAADVVTETMKRTCLGQLVQGDRVNLETPLRYHGQLGGHLVQGHVDDSGTIASKIPQKDGSMIVRIKAPKPLLRYVVEKGSIAVDGVSLTVFAVDHDSFSFAMIPHSAQATTLGSKLPGASVNLEVDLLAKYIEKLVTPRALAQ